MVSHGEFVAHPVDRCWGVAYLWQAFREAVTLCALTTLDTSLLVERAVERESGSVGVSQRQRRVR